MCTRERTCQGTWESVLSFHHVEENEVRLSGLWANALPFPSKPLSLSSLQHLHTLFVLSIFETGSLRYVALWLSYNSLEISLASNSEIHLPLPP